MVFYYCFKDIHNVRSFTQAFNLKDNILCMVGLFKRNYSNPKYFQLLLKNIYIYPLKNLISF